MCTISTTLDVPIFACNDFVTVGAASAFQKADLVSTQKTRAWRSLTQIESLGTANSRRAAYTFRVKLGRAEYLENFHKPY